MTKMIITVNLKLVELTIAKSDIRTIHTKVSSRRLFLINRHHIIITTVETVILEDRRILTLGSLSLDMTGDEVTIVEALTVRTVARERRVGQSPENADG